MTVSTVDPGPSLRKRSLYEELYLQLKNDIASGKALRGTVLLEGPLAELLGRSRAPVRQALQLLAEDGLISRFEGRGFVVGPSGTAAKRIDLAESFGHLTQTQDRPIFAWQSLYEDVERIVVYRSFFGRFRINEIELARHFGVGRTVARDVLLKLETLGITQKDDSFRWSIVPLDDQRIRDLYEVREHVEPLALVHAMDAISDEHIDKMLSRLALALDTYPDVSAATMYDLELDLHLRSIQPCPNKELLSILQRTHCILTLSKHVLGIQLEMPEYEPFLAEHVSVFRMMRRRDKEGLMLAMRSHIHGSQPKVVERAATVRRTYKPDDYSFIV
ncbi:GntR family transcriptional regulator [Rhizobium sp. SL42]|uniref:GntR family transcriptional regulator n=1 Tax=Rhizobium sp. SL42 TaxID=2806346 RepID=UPI001F3DB7B9|nr:GntR family transcriptional regulator [Rhizobium sp. SL42]UJW77236.1 GntR family transcriptional regulator [Rhizobium sp. SL42]